MNKDDLLATALKRMDEAQDAELPHRDRAQDDLRFLVGEHWPEEERRIREAEGRPVITINGLPQYVRQTTAQIRDLNPSIKVSPDDAEASKDVAEIIQGLIRHIEYACDAPSIYEQAAESAAACSMGYWRIRNDYCPGLTFDQEVRIERIANPFAVFFDPLAKHPTRKDAQYCFVVEEMSKEAFKAAYPDASGSDFTSEHRPAELQWWGGTDVVVVAEYYWIEHEDVTIHQLDGGVLWRGQLPEGIKPVATRTVKEPRVKWAKLTGSEVLEGLVDVPCRYIPVVAVTGEEWHLGGETYRSSVIRFAKEPALLYNYARSTQVEITALQPKSPYLLTKKQIAGLEEHWAGANEALRPYLVYNTDPEAPTPQRMPPPVSSEAMLTEANLSAEDMKRTTGIYDAALGARSNETSGKAIQERKLEAQNATSIYADNMVKAVRHTGEIIVDMIPKVYDTRRAVRILGEDDQEKIVVINDLMLSQEGQVPVNDVTVGKYAVRISVGPSYQTKRQESRESILQFMGMAPQMAQGIADLAAKQMDWPEADRVAERLRKMLPPGLAEQEEAPSPEQAQAMQMQQAQQMQQQQMAQAMAETEIRKAQAEAVEAEAKAEKARAEAAKAAMEAAMMQRQLTLPTYPQPM